MDLTDHSKKHSHTNNNQPKSEQARPVLGDPNYQSDPVLLEKAEKRVREIVREELAKLFLNYQRASEK